MKIFVATWFFPPHTTSEAIVTFKLFKNSKHTYDVCCASYDTSGDDWCYNKTLDMQAKNIRVFPVETDNFDVWIEECVKTFLEKNETEHYDAIMTRSMPPESIFVGKIIKDLMPDMPWIASISDPISKSPYTLKCLIYDNEELDEDTKRLFHTSLLCGVDGWANHPCAGIREMVNKKKIEDVALEGADVLIFPHDALKSYVLSGRRCQNALTVHHCFDRSLIPSSGIKPSATLDNIIKAKDKKNKVELTFLGLSDSIRTLEPLVRAMHELKRKDENACSKLHIRLIGNINEEVRTQIFNYNLYNNIVIEPSVSYATSLKIMQETDWLIHVDADFPFFEEPGRSVFFAGKLADYFSTDRPILGLTGNYSPAYCMISDAGGVCCETAEVSQLSETLRNIANGKLNPKIDDEFRAQFSASVVAKKYDEEIEQLIQDKHQTFKRPFWPGHTQSTQSALNTQNTQSAQNTASVNSLDSPLHKFLTICVPAYNTGQTLDRCLLSLANSKFLNNLEIIVVNDGSKDNTLNIACAYEKHYPDSFKVIDKENGGHGSTINAALEIATGEYFRVIDSDDWVDTSEFDAMISGLLNEEKLADLIYTNYHEINIHTSREVGRMKKSVLDHYHVYSFDDADLSMEYFTMGATMFKTSVLRRANFKLLEHCSYVDVEFFLYPIPYVETVMFTPEFVYKYAVGNEEQSVNQDNFVRKYDQHNKVMERVVKFYSEKKGCCNENQRAYLKNRIVDSLLHAHYSISLIFEPDAQKGHAQARVFDGFLKRTDEELYAAIGEKYVAIRQLREFNFDPNVYGRIPDLNLDIKAAINSCNNSGEHSAAEDTRSVPRKVASKVKWGIINRLH